MKLDLVRSREAAIVTVAALLAAVAWYARPNGNQPPPPLAPPEQPGAVQNDPGPGAPGAYLGGRLSVPSLGIAAPLVYVAQVDEELFQAALERGVVHYPGTVLPGEPGNMYVFGHSSDYRYREGSYKTVFARLPELKGGEEVVVEDASGAVFTYRVTGTAIVSASDTHYLDREASGVARLTLQTSYPVGTALRRYLVFAELVPTGP